MNTLQNKKYILECLHNLLSNNVIGDIQYSNRYKGFRGELEFYKWFRENRDKSKMHSGGFLVPKNKGQETIDEPIYFVVNNTYPNEIDKRIFNTISNIPCIKMYYFHYSNENNFNEWDTQDIMRNGVYLPVPKFNVFLFNKNTLNFDSATLSDFQENFKALSELKKKIYIKEETKSFYIEKLSVYDECDLLSIYMDRLIFDGFLCFRREHGIPSDIDIIVEAKENNDELYFLEIKEKDKSKRDPKGFGMDTRRINDINKISDKIRIKYYYIVRHIDNQKDRNFIEWLTISMDNFSKEVSGALEIEGGTGMRSEYSSNPTKICRYELFKKL